MIAGKTLLITAGTGYFGNDVLNRFFHTDHFWEIRIFSRDEKKTTICVTCSKVVK
jgi:UDP-N-acetylglucosamine 4,6-dehydratase